MNRNYTPEQQHQIQEAANAIIALEIAPFPFKSLKDKARKGEEFLSTIDVMDKLSIYAMITQGVHGYYTLPLPAPSPVLSMEEEEKAIYIRQMETPHSMHQKILQN